MKKIALLIAAIALFYSCNKSVIVEPQEEWPQEEQQPTYPENPHLGRWKLQYLSFAFKDDPNVTRVTGPPGFTYSGLDVFYDFKPDGTLIVSGDMYHNTTNTYFIDLYAAQGYVELGDFEYSTRIFWPGIYSYTVDYRSASLIISDKEGFYNYMVKYPISSAWDPRYNKGVYDFSVYERQSNVRQLFFSHPWLGHQNLIKVEDEDE